MNSDVVIFIHEFLTDFFKNQDDPISPEGVKNRETIESAVSRPLTTVAGRDAYPTPHLKAASLFHSIVGNHSFHNGNKRTALLSTLYYLGDFGYIVTCDDEEMYEFTRKTAAHEITENRNDEVQVIANWLEDNSRKQQKREKPLKYQELKEILNRFGFSLEQVDNKIHIYKGDEFYEQILKKGASGVEDYDPIYIAGLRKRLNLTAEDGVDSACFYGVKGISNELSEFTQMRIEVMKKLAKI
ncbi:hypothetical protein B9T13_02930 [Wohlfahrtiimonas chitiniclastica]|uniref:type II toxin-antitoxin system death-on-curing family toxin n=1 Tax=Wohlfahrtiimonas chitiniclastica TaxID=400946 RepID=UPI000B989704|nr:type II toxin-antitoxin system death-on-curing family toxin [Wohlfahrtiimonas chitiniclastica]OYQ71641.1 hypothetical protein B9T13_02930 [Wohlfahrtiimonas chitiniclastica]